MRFLEVGRNPAQQRKDAASAISTSTPPTARRSAPLTAASGSSPASLASMRRGRIVYFIATQESVLERHLYAVSLDGGEPSNGSRTSPAGTARHLPRTATRFIDVWSTLEHAPRARPPQHRWRASKRRSSRTPAPPREALGLRAAGVRHAARAAMARSLHGAIYRPPDPEPRQALPRGRLGLRRPARAARRDDWSLTDRPARPVSRPAGLRRLQARQPRQRQPRPRLRSRDRRPHGQGRGRRPGRRRALARRRCRSPTPRASASTAGATAAT